MARLLSRGGVFTQFQSHGHKASSANSVPRFAACAEDRALRCKGLASVSADTKRAVHEKLVESTDKKSSGRVSFADEISGGQLAQVVEVESLKQKTRWTPEERARVESEWCRGLLESLEASDAEVKSAGLARLEGAVLQLALSSNGYEVIDSALHIARCGEEQNALVHELRGHACQLVSSPYGSEVLQTCLEVMKPHSVSFIATELCGVAAALACTEEGSNVICRIIEHLLPVQTSPIISELLEDVQDLLYDEHARLVLQHICNYGNASQKEQVRQAIEKKSNLFSSH